MFVEIGNMLDEATVREFRARLAGAPWADGRVTAGYQSAAVKHNLQLPEDCAEARELGARVTAALDRSLLFQSAALPRAVFPPLFNRYGVGQEFGTHVDNAFRPLPGGRGRLRTDLSATLFLSDPAEYDGGELVVEDGHAGRAIKLAAGNLILYPATTLHSVAPVTRGERLACFFWVESLVPDETARATLFDMDISIQSLRARVGANDAALVALTGCYHNLLRRWSR